MAKKNSTVTNSGYIYVIQNENLYKLGRANNPVERLKQLQTGSSKSLKLLYFLSVKDMVAAERRLHAIFSAGRKQGEWFSFTENDLTLLKKIFNIIDVTDIEQAKLERMGFR